MGGSLNPIVFYRVGDGFPLVKLKSCIRRMDIIGFILYNSY